MTVRVLHIVNSLDLGGAERMARDLVTHFDPRTFAPAVLCLFSEGAMAADIRAEGIEVSSLDLPPVVSPRHLWRVYRAVLAQRPSIVHTHLPEAAWYGLPAAALAGVPIRVAHLQNSHPTWSRKLRSWDRTVSRLATRVIACSQAVLGFHEDVIGYRTGRSYVIHNSVDLSRFADMPARAALRTRFDVPRDAPTLVCVASLTPQKNHALLLRAFAEVQAEVPDALLLIVGDGGERARLENLASRLGVSPQVRFLGRRRDVAELLSCADLFVLTSAWEGMGLVLAEAAAAGLPSVATAVDGVPEVVGHDETGLLVPSGDSDAVAAAVLRLLREPELRWEMSRRARIVARDKFSLTAAVDAVQRVYLESLTSAPAG